MEKGWPYVLTTGVSMRPFSMMIYVPILVVRALSRLGLALSKMNLFSKWQLAHLYSLSGRRRTSAVLRRMDALQTLNQKGRSFTLNVEAVLGLIQVQMTVRQHGTTRRRAEVFTTLGVLRHHYVHGARREIGVGDRCRIFRVCVMSIQESRQWVHAAEPRHGKMR